MHRLVMGVKKGRPITSDGPGSRLIPANTLCPGGSATAFLSVDPRPDQGATRSDRQEHRDHGPPEPNVAVTGLPASTRPVERAECYTQVDHTNTHAEDALHVALLPLLEDGGPFRLPDAAKCKNRRRTDQGASVFTVETPDPALQIGPWSFYKRGQRERISQIAAISLRHDPIVQDQYGASIRSSPYQSPEALFQAKGGVRQDEARKRILPPAL